MDALELNIPNVDEIERELTDAAHPAEDGTLYVRAFIAAKIIGITPSVQSAWIRDRRIKPLRLSVPPSQTASRGFITAWPLDQAIACARRYWTQGRRKWTMAEDDYLADKLGTWSAKRIARMLGRTEDGVRQRSTYLGITPRNAQGKLTTGEVARLCDVSRECVQYWIFKMATPLRYRRTATRDRAKVITADAIRIFFRDNPAVFDRLSKTARRRVENYAGTVHQRRKAVAP